MTDIEAELSVFQLVNDKGKFAVAVHYRWPTPEAYYAFERLMTDEHIRLIDVTPIAEHPDVVFRIFKITESGLKYYASLPKPVQ